MQYGRLIASALAFAGLSTPVLGGPTLTVRDDGSKCPEPSPVAQLVEGTDKYFKFPRRACLNWLPFALTQQNMDDLSAEWWKVRLASPETNTEMSACIQHGQEWTAVASITLFNGWTLYDFGEVNAKKVIAKFLEIRRDLEEPVEFVDNLYRAGGSEDPIGYLYFHGYPQVFSALVCAKV